MGYQVNAVGTYWLLEDMVEYAAEGTCCTCALLSMFLQALWGKPWIIDSYH